MDIALGIKTSVNASVLGLVQDALPAPPGFMAIIVTKFVPRMGIALAMDTVMVGSGNASALQAGSVTIAHNHVQQGISVLRTDQGRSRVLKGVTKPGREAGGSQTVHCVQKGRFLLQREPRQQELVRFAKLGHICQCREVLSGTVNSVSQERIRLGLGCPPRTIV